MAALVRTFATNSLFLNMVLRYHVPLLICKPRHVGCVRIRHRQRRWRVRCRLDRHAAAELQPHGFLECYYESLHAYAVSSYYCVCFLLDSAELKCPVLNDASAQASWAVTNAGTSSVRGTCNPNTSGSPTRNCELTGSWSSVTGSCITNPCPALTNDNNANWPSPAAVNMNVQGTCVSGYSSSSAPTRLCQSNGQWSSSITNPCTRNQCAGETEGNAVWPTTLSLTSVNGTCVAGWSGSPKRDCMANGAFSSISNACTRTRPSCRFSVAHHVYRDHVPRVVRKPRHVGGVGIWHEQRRWRVRCRLGRHAAAELQPHGLMGRHYESLHAYVVKFLFLFAYWNPQS